MKELVRRAKLNQDGNKGGEKLERHSSEKGRKKDSPLIPGGGGNRRAIHINGHNFRPKVRWIRSDNFYSQLVSVASSSSRSKNRGVRFDRRLIGPELPVEYPGPVLTHPGGPVREERKPSGGEEKKKEGEVGEGRGGGGEEG